ELVGEFSLPATTPGDALNDDRVTCRATPRCIQADSPQFRNDLVGNPLECVGIILYASVGHQKLPCFDGSLGTLQMIEDVALNGLLLLGFFSLVPDFCEPAVVAATEVLPRHNALTVEGRERLVEAVAVRRWPPSGLLRPVRREQLGREPLNLG